MRSKQEMGREGVELFRRKYKVRAAAKLLSNLGGESGVVLAVKFCSRMPAFLNCRVSSRGRMVLRRVPRTRRMRSVAIVQRSSDHREDILGRSNDPRMWH